MSSGLVTPNCSMVKGDGTRQPSPSLNASSFKPPGQIRTHYFCHALPITQDKRIKVDQASNAISSPVGDTSYHCSAIAVPSQYNVSKIFIVEYRKHVLNICVEPNISCRQMLPFAEACQRWREHFGTSLPETRASRPIHQPPHQPPCTKTKTIAPPRGEL
jgi:hypothetical protein